MPTEAKINLQNEVTETEKNKNNLKQAKSNIDNKLVELGGDASTNIFNVPEKIEKMSEEYLKYALFTSNILTQNPTRYDIEVVTDYYLLKSFPIKFNTNFSPISVFLDFDFAIEFSGKTYSEKIILKNDVPRIVNKFSSGYSHYPIIKLQLRVNKTQVYLDMYARSNETSNISFLLTSMITIRANYLECFSKNIEK